MNPELLIINEHKSEKYPPRTYYNATSAEVTLALALNLETAGEKLTKKAAGERYIGFKLTPEIDDIVIARQLYSKMKKDNAHTLNVAGNGIYTLSEQGCSQEFINYFTYKIISIVHKHWPIEKIYTGGQSGVDISGAVTGYLLGIPTEVTLPNGYLQRFEDGHDVKGTREKVFNQINNGALKLMERLDSENNNKSSTNNKPKM